MKLYDSQSVVLVRANAELAFDLDAENLTVWNDWTVTASPEASRKKRDAGSSSLLVTRRPSALLLRGRPLLFIDISHCRTPSL